MGQSKGTKRTANTESGGVQQQISTMFGEKVKKPRMYMGSAISAKPIAKPAPQVPSNIGTADPPSLPDPVASQKRRWRLSELVKKERESRVRTSISGPSFVFEAPHMDTRRPQHSKKSEAQVELRWNSNDNPRKRLKLSPDSVKYVAASETPISAKAQDKLGSDALLYDRTMLPNSHSLLLDVLQGLESAISLLRTRKALPTVAAVRDIVSRSTRRSFTLRILSQLAHVVPEAVAVLPGTTNAPKLKRPSDNLIIRLDDVDTRAEKDLATSTETAFSKLGDSPARLRRSLLHKRLLSHVREHHENFLKMSKATRHSGNLWHPDFDVEAEVPELPAPPLYPTRLTSALDKKDTKVSKEKRPLEVRQGQVAAKTEDSVERVVGEDRMDVGIPQSLLERVRARERERSRITAPIEMERTAKLSLLMKLPCTMDTVSSILRSERRSAIGWLQLLSRLEKLHPNKWTREDLEAQLIAITDLASKWCRKVALKSSRGGYAFRVIAPDQFATARDKVSATKSYPNGEK